MYEENSMEKKIISLSLGSSLRDKSVTIEQGRHIFHLCRKGFDGNMRELMSAIEACPEDVDVITLGGIDIRLVLLRKSYIFRDAARLLHVAGNRIVVDGEMFKEWAEPEFFRQLLRQGVISADSKVLFPLVSNRLFLAQAMREAGIREMVFGDLIYDIGMPVFPIRSIESYNLIGCILGPFITALPFSWVYPTGEKQEVEISKRPDLFEEADLIAGDFHNIRKFLIADLHGKTILTNTVTADDVELMQRRGLKFLITFSPNQEGRTFGANMIEGVVAAYLQEQKKVLSYDTYMQALQELEIGPEIRRLN